MELDPPPACGAVHRTHTAPPPVWVRSMATGRSSVALCCCGVCLAHPCRRCPEDTNDVQSHRTPRIGDACGQ